MEEKKGSVFSAHLEQLVADLRATLGDAAEVTRDDDDFRGGRVVRVTPSREGALPIWWLELGDGVILEVLGSGGRWELGTTESDMRFLESVVRAVLAGRVTEVVAGGRRSRVSVVLSDGTVVTSTATGCLPWPFWPRWGRTNHVEPYLG